ncbi:MAG: hypothetical protein JO117_00675 [Verrucomicrobia bacterium]|nr:hypothetical protein [Verrucomicrobiota bacterium]MBV9658324.1 hypothetical protein [Verrucomicrobiota bacterium]
MKTSAVNLSLLRDRPLTAASPEQADNYPKFVPEDRRTAALELVAYVLFGLCSVASVAHSIHATLGLTSNNSLHAVVVRALPQDGAIVQSAPSPTPQPKTVVAAEYL